jgi:hypothetical protein
VPMVTMKRSLHGLWCTIDWSGDAMYGRKRKCFWSKIGIECDCMRLFAMPMEEE